MLTLKFWVPPPCLGFVRYCRSFTSKLRFTRCSKICTMSKDQYYTAVRRFRVLDLAKFTLSIQYRALASTILP